MTDRKVNKNLLSRMTCNMAAIPQLSWLMRLPLSLLTLGWHCQASPAPHPPEHSLKKFKKMHEGVGWDSPCELGITEYWRPSSCGRCEGRGRTGRRVAWPTAGRKRNGGPEKAPASRLSVRGEGVALAAPASWVSPGRRGGVGEPSVGSVSVPHSFTVVLT